MHNERSLLSPLPVRERIAGEGPYTARDLDFFLDTGYPCPRARDSGFRLCLLGIFPRVSSFIVPDKIAAGIPGIHSLLTRSRKQPVVGSKYEGGTRLVLSGLR
jgi:hypothetical protein